MGFRCIHHNQKAAQGQPCACSACQSCSTRLFCSQPSNKQELDGTKRCNSCFMLKALVFTSCL